MTSYDLNDIAEKLASAMDVDTWLIDGVMQKVTTYSEVPGTANVPALAIELDDITYDETMGRGADAFVFLAYLLVSSADSLSGQRLTRQLLSSGPASLVTSIKDALLTDQTLGGLVSYATITGTRTIGVVNYGGIPYLGATLEVQVMS